MIRACLVDVYDTIVKSDFEPRARVLAALAGVEPGAWAREWVKTGTQRGLGRLSMAGSFAQTLLACGARPRPGLVAELVREDARLLREQALVYDDTVGFLGEVRSRGTGIALVSNCSQNTRPMLEELGVLSLTDAAVLSCEVGWLKPSPEIYASALDELGVAPADAVMIDDQARFCAGAEAAGVRAIQLVRADHHGEVAETGFPVVRTLAAALALLAVAGL